MPPLPPLPWIAPDPGRIWLAAGACPAPGSLAALRTAVLFRAAAVSPPPLAGVREVTVVPAREALLPPETLVPLVRDHGCTAVVRLEWWLEPGGPALSAALLRVLAQAQPLFVHAVLAAPGALSADAQRMLQELVDAGVPTAADLILARGGLAEARAVQTLCLALQRAGTRPYCLVDGAWLPPERRVPRAAALEIVRGLRGWISGLAVPQLVEEGADGGRTAVIPDYVRQLDADGVEVENFEGRRLRYSNPPKDPG